MDQTRRQQKRSLGGFSTSRLPFSCNTTRRKCQGTYCQTSNKSHTKSQNLNVPRRVLQLSLRNLLKPGVKSKMKMQLGQRQQEMLQLHLSDQQYYCLLSGVLHQRFEGISQTLSILENIKVTWLRRNC